LAQYEGIYWDEDAEAAYYAVIVDNDELVIERPGRFRAVATPQAGEGKFALQGGIVKIEFDSTTEPAASMTLTTLTRSERQERHKHDPNLPAIEEVIAKVKKAQHTPCAVRMGSPCQGLVS
jgi:hypothetical protein